MYVVRSMSRAGTPTDNSAMESINGWIKAELFMDFHVTGERPVYEEVNEYSQADIRNSLRYLLITK